MTPPPTSRFSSQKSFSPLSNPSFFEPPTGSFSVDTFPTMRLWLRLFFFFFSFTYQCGPSPWPFFPRYSIFDQGPWALVFLSEPYFFLKPPHLSEGCLVRLQWFLRSPPLEYRSVTHLVFYFYLSWPPPDCGWHNGGYRLHLVLQSGPFFLFR